MFGQGVASRLRILSRAMYCTHPRPFRQSPRFPSGCSIPISSPVVSSLVTAHCQATRGRTNRMQATARRSVVVLMVVSCSPSPDPGRSGHEVSPTKQTIHLDRQTRLDARIQAIRFRAHRPPSGCHCASSQGLERTKPPSRPIVDYPALPSQSRKVQNHAAAHRRA